MTAKQVDLLNQINSSLLNNQEDRFLTGTKYKNGNQSLDAHDLSQDQWMELVSMQDYPDLWNDASKYMNSL
jgi:hypothetical protein